MVSKSIASYWVVGFGVWAVSRKTPIYFVILKDDDNFDEYDVNDNDNDNDNADNNVAGNDDIASSHRSLVLLRSLQLRGLELSQLCHRGAQGIEGKKNHYIAVWCASSLGT